MDDLSELRREYRDAHGKRPFMGWNAEELRSRLGKSPPSNVRRRLTLAELNARNARYDAERRKAISHTVERCTALVREGHGDDAARRVQQYLAKLIHGTAFTTVKNKPVRKLVA